MITFEQVKADINSGKSTRIYFSAHTMWWTHLDADVQEATTQGRQARKTSHDRLMQRNDVPAADKERVQSLYERASQGDTPLDPSGSPLMETGDPAGWIRKAEEKHEHFGKHKLDALMLGHHQNCEGQCYRTWANYNEVLDRKGKKEREAKWREEARKKTKALKDRLEKSKTKGGHV